MMNRAYFYRVVIALTSMICGSMFQAVDAGMNSGEGPPLLGGHFVTQVTGNTAYIAAFVFLNGAGTNTWIEFGESLPYTNTVQPQLLEYNDQWFSKTIYGLEPVTKYHYRIVAQNKFGIIYGPDTTFSTVIGPLLSTPISVCADSITQTSARLHAKCRVNGFPTWVYFFGGMKMNESLYDFRNVYVGSGTTDIETTFVVQNLIPNTVYNYSLHVSSNGSIITGDNQTFSTGYDSAMKGLLIPIQIKDKMGRINMRRFGVHTVATNCEDRKLDEFELPPPPPSDMLEARFLVQCIGLGTYTDIRPYVSSAQIDTYKLKFQTDLYKGYPVNISWSPLDSLYSGKVILKIRGDSINMKGINSYDIENSDISAVTIIAEAPRPITRAPEAVTGEAGIVGREHGQMNARINPNGLATTAWFEWGPSTAYGKITQAQGVGNEAGHLPVGEFIFGLQENTQFHYRAVAQNANGILYGDDQAFTTTEMLGIESPESLPVGYFLSHNYPNPFNPSTKIQFSVASSQLTNVTIYDLLGREVETLVNEVLNPGTYSVNWDASQFSSGVYFYRLRAGSFMSIKKMLLAQ